MLCKKCKQEIPDNSIYCNLCGKKQVVTKSKTKKRANGQGTVTKISSKPLAKPYRAMLPAEYIGGKEKKRILGYYATKTEALNALSNYLSKDIKIDITLTLSQIYEKWSVTHFKDLADKSITSYKVSYKHLSTLHNKKFKELRADDVQKIVDTLASQKSRATLSKIRDLYSQLCKYAMSIDLINQNYAQFIKLPKQDKKEKEIFTLDEISIIKSQCSEDTAKQIMILLYTGMRVGELFDIKRSDVHLATPKPYMIGGNKTDAGKNRLIPINPNICSYIEYFYNKKADAEYLCTNTAGGQVDVANWRKREYYPLLKQLGVRPLSPHSTRHTYATLMQEAGVNPDDLIKLIGHSDYNTTMENYIHQTLDKLYAENCKIKL